MVRARAKAPQPYAGPPSDNIESKVGETIADLAHALERN
jgi:hypothetical protein